ncbi:VSIG8 protein, partial [Rhinopomastus cyanomelas]|nr:VSIG8 protein [Rhinopomastus cyanomelas]
DHHVNYGSGSGLQDRVAFVQNDPGQYDASIRVADLQESDTGTYQCRVKKNTVAVHEVIVTVQGETPPSRALPGRVAPLASPAADCVHLPTEKPATPQCWVEGEQIWGSSAMLRCFSR